MTDLRTATAQDLLGRLRSMERPLSSRTLLIADAAGLTDLRMLVRHLDELTADAGDELSLLTDQGRRFVTPVLAEIDISYIVKVGHLVYLQDRDNLTDWVELTRTIKLADRMEWRPRLGTNYLWRGGAQTRRFIAALLAAGRSPHYARLLVERAVEHKISPDTYGFGPALTPGTFSDLAQAGVDGASLDVLLADGVTLDDAVSLIADGCPAGGIVAAKQQGIPREQWQGLLVGMNENWFPLFDGDESRRMDPIDQGALGRLKFTWGQLRALADNGWNDVSSYNMLEIRYGSSNRSDSTIKLTTDQAVDIAEAGVTHEVMCRWATALTTASRDRTAPKLANTPLVPYGQRTVTEILPQVVALRLAGVSPSNLNDYRYAGCSSVRDVLRAAAAGITGARAKYLRERYGEKLATWDKRLYLRDLHALLTAHERDKDQDPGRDR